MGYQSVRWDKLPEVCKGCRFRDSDSADEYSPNYHFCKKGLFLPTKSNQCKIKDKHKSHFVPEKTFCGISGAFAFNGPESIDEQWINHGGIELCQKCAKAGINQIRQQAKGE